MQPTPVFLPGESHGQRSLAGYSSWGCKESDMTEHTRQQLRDPKIKTPLGSAEKAPNYITWPSMAKTVKQG